MPTSKTTGPLPAGFDAAWRYPLMEAIFKRRTRRIALGSGVWQSETLIGQDELPHLLRASLTP
jgi:hypothetical protein